MEYEIDLYFNRLAQISREVACTDSTGNALPRSEAFDWMVECLRLVVAHDAKVIFIGNGGSAGIASHMAIDFLKNGGVAAMALNDGAALTCLGNDLGYEQVFARQIRAHARTGDLLIAISSSGRSRNILEAVASARERGCRIAGFSGFAPDNPLRRMGDLNFYVASDHYGFVENAHQGLIHAILDFAMGFAASLAGGRPFVMRTIGEAMQAAVAE